MGEGRATVMRAPRLALAWLVALAVLCPAPAGAQGKQEPSAGELLRDYPLHPETQDGASSARTSPQPVVAERRESADGDQGADGIGPLEVGLVLLPVLGAAVLVLRRRRRSAGVRVPAAAQPPAEASAPAAVRGAPAVPPAPECAWTAEIRWQLAPDPHFYAWASSDDRPEPVTVERSAALEWPPDSNGAVRALGDAVRGLEASLLAAGWQPATPGTAWFAKRFAWAPRVDARAQDPHGPAGRTPPGRVPVTRTEEGPT